MDRKAMITEYIKKEIVRNDKATISEDEDLLSSGVLDSLGILQLVAYIQDTFGIEVPDKDVVYENFHSIKSLDDYLKQYAA
jgi:acyl carrier protein